MNTLRCCTFFLTLLLLLAGCTKRENSHSHAHEGHQHTAPHGGTLVEVGEHAYQVELVLDSEAGKLTAYVLDGHAENFKRIVQRSVEIVTTGKGGKQTLVLAAVANVATGETVGDTSQFEGQADWLKGVKTLEGSISHLQIDGRIFSIISFKL